MHDAQRKMLVLPLALATLVAACETTEPIVIDEPDMIALQTTPVPDEVAVYLYSGIPNKRRLYVKDMDTWTALWNDVTANISPRPPVPFIDFGKEALIVAAMGTRGTGGYSISVEGVGESDGKLFVEVLEVSPGPNCLLTQALTAPVHAVRAPLRNGEVVFTEVAKVQSCGP